MDYGIRTLTDATTNVCYWGNRVQVLNHRIV